MKQQRLIRLGLKFSSIEHVASGALHSIVRGEQSQVGLRILVLVGVLIGGKHHQKIGAHFKGRSTCEFEFHRSTFRRGNSLSPFYVDERRHTESMSHERRSLVEQTLRAKILTFERPPTSSGTVPGSVASGSLAARAARSTLRSSSVPSAGRRCGAS